MDGPIPIGDAVYIGVGVVLTIGAAIEKYGKNYWKELRKLEIEAA